MALLSGYGGAATNVAVTNGVDWVSPANASGAPSGGSFATFTLASPANGKLTDILQIASFGLALPSDIGIDGISITTRYHKNSSADPINVTLKSDPPGGPSVVSSVKQYMTGYAGGSPGTVTLGGATDLWGAAWTELACEWIYVQLQCVGTSSGAGVTGGIDGVQVNVYYHSIVTDVDFEHAMQHPRDSSPYAAGALYVEASDDFGDGVVGPMWGVDNTNGQVVASEVGGFLQYVVTSGATAGQAAVTHWPARDLRETISTIEVPTKVAQAALYLILYQISAGGAGPGGYQQVRWSSNTVDAYSRRAGADFLVGSAAGSTLQRMRIRNTGGYSHFEWYNGSVWASLGSVPYCVGLDDAVNRLDVIKQGTLGTTIKYDNYSLERYSPNYVEPFTTNPLGVTLGAWASGGTAVVPTVTGGRLACALPTGIAALQYSGANWAPGHVDPRGGVFQVKVEMPDSGGIQAVLNQIVQFSGGSPNEGDQKHFQVAATHVLNGDRYVQAAYHENGTFLYGASFALTSRTFWLRIDFSLEGRALAQYSYDGSAWTTIMVWSPPWPLAKVKPAGIGQVFAVSWQSGSPAGTVYFDDYSNVGFKGFSRWPVYDGLLAGGLAVEAEASLQPPSVEVPVSFGAAVIETPVASTLLLPGLAVPTVVGSPALRAQAGAFGFSIPVVFGAPLLAAPGNVSPAGLVVPVSFGSARFVAVALETTGFLVPVQFGSVAFSIGAPGFAVPVAFGTAAVRALLQGGGFTVPVALGTSSVLARLSAGGLLVPWTSGFDHDVVPYLSIYVVVDMEAVDLAVEMEAVDAVIRLESVDRTIELV